MSYDSELQKKDLAEQDVRRLVGISDQVGIRPRVNAANLSDDITHALLSDDITHALHRSWLFDPNTVAVSVDGGKVCLTGTVDTLRDRQVAAATAWAAPGVTGVENDLTIN